LLLAEAILLGIFFPALSVRPARPLSSVLTLTLMPLLTCAGYVLWTRDDTGYLLAGACILGLPTLAYVWVRTAGRFLHIRVGGAPDRRYRTNPWIPSFAAGARQTAGCGHVGDLLAACGAGLFLFLRAPVATPPSATAFPVEVTATSADDLVVKTSCYLRREPRQDGEVMLTVPPHTRVSWIEKSGVWWRVQVDGKQGYLHLSCVRAATGPSRK